jgi:uncharacterized cupin superfamily protein
MLVGWGLFNVVEGVIDHHILTIHHVREGVDNQWAYDVGFLAFGVALSIGGWMLARSEERTIRQSRARVRGWPTRDRLAPTSCAKPHGVSRGEKNSVFGGCLCQIALVDVSAKRCRRIAHVVPEAPLVQSDAAGLVPGAEGWFVLNAHDACWWWDGGSGCSEFEGKHEFQQVGSFLRVLSPGSPMGLYHRELDQEGFLVLSGEALLVVEGEERPLRQWDFFHCPPGTEHVIIGAGEGPCVVLAVGSREHQWGDDWGAYTVNETALRHGAGVSDETSDRDKAYAGAPQGELTSYRDGWLPG